MRKDEFGGVIIIPTAKDLETGEKIVLIEKIYRIPVQKYMLEFPAGMRDSSDTDPCDAAMRELKEETGYVGHNARAKALVKSDPWKSNGTHCQVYIDVDLSTEENKNPVTDLEPEEDITPMWVKVKGLKESLEKMAAEMDCDLDQRLYTWALGIDYAQRVLQK